jgi:hypothetical protein
MYLNRRKTVGSCRRGASKGIGQQIPRCTKVLPGTRILRGEIDSHSLHILLLERWTNGKKALDGCFDPIIVPLFRLLKRNEIVRMMTEEETQRFSPWRLVFSCQKHTERRYAPPAVAPPEAHASDTGNTLMAAMAAMDVESSSKKERRDKFKIPLFLRRCWRLEVSEAGGLKEATLRRNITNERAWKRNMMSRSH